MSYTLPEVVEWIFYGEELSVGVYRIWGRDVRGRSIDVTGFDEVDLLEKCKQYALSLASGRIPS